MAAKTDDQGFKLKPDGTYDLSAPPPFTLQDLRNAIPAHCWRKSLTRSLLHAAGDIVIVTLLAVAAYKLNTWWVWPIYWLAQGTMFWALFVIGHDCGHGSFSDSRKVNDFVGHAVHSFILVPYHGWRLSHKKHHGNHGHVENDESWHPIVKSMYDVLPSVSRLGRLGMPSSLFAYPFYLWYGSPGRNHSHYHPESDLFTPAQRHLVITSDACLVTMLCFLAAGCWALGPKAVLQLYVVPYWIFVAWLDVVTYLHHHGSHDANEKMPWYRGEEWSYLRGGLTTIDRDYGMFNLIHHDIGTHVVHHLFPQIPHYRLREATAAIKPILGPYYREPAKSPGPLPVHLVDPLLRSFATDHYVDDTGDVVFYKTDYSRTPAKKVD